MKQRPIDELPPLCQSVRRVRQSLEETQAIFARRIGIDPISLSRFERGAVVPRAPRVLLGLMDAACAAGRAEESEEFRHAFIRTTGPRAPDVSVRAQTGDELAFESIRFWRFMAAARTAWHRFPEHVPAIEAAMKPVLDFIDEELTSARSVCVNRRAGLPNTSEIACTGVSANGAGKGN